MGPSLIRVLFWGALMLPAGSSAAADPPASATERYRGRMVREVRLDYGGASPPKASLQLVAVAAGERYRPEAVRRSIRQLFALASFSDIKVEVLPAGADVDVVFRLFPRIEIESVRLEGLEGRSALDDLRSPLIEEGGLRPGDPFDVESLAAAADRITARLRREGYLWAQVEPEASFQSPLAVIVFHVEPGARARVGRLEIEGVAPHLETHIRRELDLPPGSPYSRAELDRKLNRLASRWKELGFYGATVTAEEVATGDARVDVRIKPETGPRVRIEVEGWDFSDKELDELVPLFAEARFTADLIEESRANLEEHIRERGYRDAAVAVERESLGEDDYLILRFRAEPGPRFEVRAIDFEGLRSVSEAELRSLLVTRSRRRVRSAPFRQKTWDDDLREIRTYLDRQGFHRAQVETRARVDLERPELLHWIVRLDEGPRAFVGAVELTGAEAVAPESVLEASRLAPGMAFSGSEVVAARERIVTLYRNAGFRSAEVEARTSLDPEGTNAVVAFSIREGEQTRVEQVIISGLRATQEAAVRRLTTLKAGEPLSALALTETRQKLIGSGLFRSVDIEALPPDPVTRRSNVLVTVEEGPRTTFAYGFGYEERQLARAELEVTRRNVFGLNRTVSVFTRAGFRGGRFITTYRQPDTFGYDVPLFVSAFAEEEQRTSFDYNRVGVGLQFSRRLAADQNLLLRYRFDQTKVFQLEVDIEEIDRRFRNTRISALSLATVTDRRDDPLDPQRGEFRILDLEWSATALGTEDPYVKGLGQQFFYFRLPKDMVAAVGLRLGVAKTLRGDRDALLPVAERFFAGGANTLRGFGLDEASPKRKIELPSGEVVDGEPIGGNVLTLVNLELRFPILGNLRGVVFSDNGTVYRRLEIIELLNWRYNLGFGFRYDTPLGPLRVDYGFKLDRRSVRSIHCPDVSTPCQEPFGRWHVSLGHAF